jgi:hypothetical protein
MAKSKSYKTPKGMPKSVKYWDDKFKRSSVWMSWIALKTELSTKVSDVMSECECSESDAIYTIWNAFDAIINGDEESPVWNEYKDWICSNSDDDLLYISLHLAIGSYIHAGQSESEARESFKEDAKDDPDVLDGWGCRITDDLRVVKR